jgi:hypothetical protein
MQTLWHGHKVWQNWGSRQISGLFLFEEAADGIDGVVGILLLLLR